MCALVAICTEESVLLNSTAREEGKGRECVHCMLVLWRYLGVSGQFHCMTALYCVDTHM